MVAQRLTTDSDPQVFTCGDGTVDAGEQCDTSGPNGDQACPGACVPSGQPDECTCGGGTTTTTSSTTSTIQTTTTTTTTTTTVTTVTTLPEVSPTTTT